MGSRIYEEERLLLYAQEALAKAIAASGLRRAGIARAMGVSRWTIYKALNANMKLATAAAIAHAAGYRIVPTLEKL